MTENGNVPKSGLAGLASRFAGCILGGAIGDALGSPTEGKTPAEIQERFGGRVDTLVEPFGPKPDGRHKGDGYITDDTLMVLALIRAYLEKGDQMDAHDMATYLVPEIFDKPTWVPEFEREMPLINRLFYPEKYLYLRLRLASVNPREGGIGNMVNCGAAMYAAPVGLMNAGDPDLAYQRAILMYSAHQYSYGLEAAGVMAACVAEAVRPEASINSVVETALRLAKDGTRQAISAVVEAAKSAPAEETDCQRHLRAAMEPYDTVKGGTQEFTRMGFYPSQFHSIEELPLALAYLIIGRGDYRTTVLGAINYGRDSDSIAGMAGALLGALTGKESLPADWVAEITTRNRINFEETASALYRLFERCYQAEWNRAQQRHKAISQLSGVEG